GGDERADDDVFDGPAARSRNTPIENALCRVVEANSRVMEQTVGQLSSIVTSLAGLLQLSHDHRAVLPPPMAQPPTPPPPPAPPPVEPEDDDVESDDDDEGDDDEDRELEPVVTIEPAKLPVWVELIINKVVEVVIAKVTTNGGIGGLPWDAIADWRKA